MAAIVSVPCIQCSHQPLKLMKQLKTGKVFAECPACKTGYWSPNLEGEFSTDNLYWERTNATLDEARMGTWTNASVEGEMVSDVVPTPDEVATFTPLDRVPLRRMPWWAAEWLTQGYDGDSLRLLAGLNETDLFEIADLMPAVLNEVNASLPGDTKDALNRSFSYVARLCLDGRLTEQAAVQMVEHLIAAGGFDVDFYSLPLGASFGLDDEWEGRWGRSSEALTAEVRRLCEVQISSGTDAP